VYQRWRTHRPKNAPFNGLDSRRGRAQVYHRVDTTRRLRPFWDGERIHSLRTLAIGERVGNAGPDLFRSPMKRCSHARFPRRESLMDETVLTFPVMQRCGRSGETA
jgi:hypothetical protein